MSARKANKLAPVAWGLLLFVIAQVIVLLVTPRIDPFLDEQEIFVPSQPSEAVTWWPGAVTLPDGQVVEVPVYSSLGPVLIYVFLVVAVLVVVLILIPPAALRFVIRLLFALMFSWGAFIALVFFLSLPLAIVLAVALGAVWFITPFVWLHNLALVLAITSLGAVFGRFISPWTAMLLIAILAVYDFVAVRFRFMTWMADSLAKAEALPAVFIPRGPHGWRRNLKRAGAMDIAETDPGDRKYSILGGGDVAFPCLLTASVYFAQGLGPGIIIAVFGLLGLTGAYVIQAVFLKGRPMPALPPIAALTLVGLLLIL